MDKNIVNDFITSIENAIENMSTVVESVHIKSNSNGTYVSINENTINFYDYREDYNCIMIDYSTGDTSYLSKWDELSKIDDDTYKFTFGNISCIFDFSGQNLV